MSLRPASAIVALAVPALALHAWMRDGISDDAFILLRYARNLVEGHGLVYNVGDRVEGYTSFLWTIAVACCGFLGLDYLVAARALGLVCAGGLVVAATVAVLRALDAEEFKEGSRWIVAVPGVVLAASAPLAVWSLCGLETAAYSLAVVMSLVTSLRCAEGPAAGATAGVLLALTALLRPEGIVVGIVLCAAALLFDRTLRGVKAALPMLLTFDALVSAHLLWRYAYYGDWLPNTYYAKVGNNATQWKAGIEYVFAYFSDYGSAALWLAPLVAAFWRRDRAWWTAAALWLAMLGSIVWVGGDGLFMYRFMVPTVAVWSILFATLLNDGLRFTRKRRPETLVPVGIGVTIAVALVAVTGLHLGGKGYPYGEFVYQRDHEIPTWTAVGRLIAKNAAPGDSLACVPIGAVGYYSRLTVYDMLGLTDRHIARREVEVGRGWQGHEKHDGPYVLSREPTYLLLGNIRVSANPVPLDAPNFVRTNNEWVEAREGDIFVPRLAREYRPVMAQLPDGRYLRFLMRKDR